MADLSDDGIDRFVRDGFLFVASGVKEHGRRFILEQREGESGEVTFSDTACAVEQNGGRLGRKGMMECAAEALQFFVSSDQCEGWMMMGRALDGLVGEGLCAEKFKDICALWAFCGVALKEFKAKVADPIGDARDDLLWCDGFGGVFLSKDLDGASFEGESAGEGLVKDHADAVPVAGFGERLMEGLFRRHIGGCSGDLHTLFGGVFAQLGHKAKVEDHHSPFGGDENVGGFEVAVQESEAMEGRDTLREMRECVEQAAKMDVGGFGRWERRRGSVFRRDLRRGEKKLGFRFKGLG